MLGTTPIRSSIIMAMTLVAIAGCDDDPVAPPDDAIEESFIFDAGMEGWDGVAADTLDPPIEWHVEHTSDIAATGDGSVELHLENLNDAGKVWMEREFAVEPGESYDVEIEYAFGTSDWGEVNLFTIIAGVHDDPPRSADDLTFQDDTGHGGDEDVGVVWQERSHSFSLQAPDDGTVHVALGVWGTWEATRTYYIDDVTVRFTP